MSATTRRALLAFSGAALGAAVATPASTAAPISYPATDTVDQFAGATPTLSTLYANWIEAERVSDVIHNEAEAVRAQLIARWGDCPRGVSAQDLWGNDPMLSVLTATNERSNAACCVSYDVFMALMAYPVASVADVSLKLMAAASMWAETPLDDASEFHETVTADFMRQASAFLRSDVMGRA